MRSVIERGMIDDELFQAGINLYTMEVDGVVYTITPDGNIQKVEACDEEKVGDKN